MAVTKNFLDRFSARLDDIDAGSRQAYILRLMKERGFLETVFNAIEEGILVIDRHLLIPLSQPGGAGDSGAAGRPVRSSGCRSAAGGRLAADSRLR